jgi:sterol 3beta-glucosyltransferase
MFGLLAYPAQGIYKSIKSSGKNNITGKIRAEKLASFQRQVSTKNSTVTKLGGLN